MAETIRHGSHDHQLQHMGTMDASVRAANCRACGLPFESENVDLFGCGSCGFFLHRSCCVMPKSLKNPAHPQHQLELRYTPAYNDGIFYCDICGNNGLGFNYHCQTCKFDAHVPCVNLPQTMKGRPAHNHRLRLQLRPPATGNTSCCVCGLQIRYCCYSCSPCSFFLHPQCRNRQPMTGSSINQDGPQQGSNNQQGPTKQNKRNLWKFGGKIIMGAAVGTVVHGFLGGIDIPGIDMDGWFGDGAGEDNDVQDGDHVDDGDEDVNDDGEDLDDDDDDFGDDMSTLGQTPGGYVGSALREEARSLAFEHMARMGI